MPGSGRCIIKAMKASLSRTRTSTQQRRATARRLSLRRLERLEAGYLDVQVKLERLQHTLDAALATGELSLATVDAEQLESVRRFEASRLQGAGRRLRSEMKSLKAADVVDAKGRRVRNDVPEDMQQGADCDL
jgi:hypothetical protein